jgi:hypothetical protein
MIDAPNLLSPGTFCEILYQKMNGLNAGLEELELYEFPYALDNLYPECGGWASVELDPKEEIEKRLHSGDFYTAIQIKPRGGDRIVLDEAIVRLTHIGIKVVYLTDDAVRMKRKWKRDIDYGKKYEPTYFRNRGFRGQFLIAEKCYRPQMEVCDMVVDATGAAIWTTPEIAEILTLGTRTE